MSSVAELVREARDLGAEFRLDGDTITVESPAHLPADLMAELRAHKPEVRKHLGIGRGLLLERLHRGTAWLATVNAELLALPDAGVGSEQERQFCEGLALWDRLETLLRFVYRDFTDCILGHGQRCPAAAPVRCAACTSAEGANAVAATESKIRA